MEITLGLIVIIALGILLGKGLIELIKGLDELVDLFILLIRRLAELVVWILKMLFKYTNIMIKNIYKYYKESR